MFIFCCYIDFYLLLCCIVDIMYVMIDSHKNYGM